MDVKQQDKSNGIKYENIFRCYMACLRLYGNYDHQDTIFRI